MKKEFERIPLNIQLFADPDDDKDKNPPGDSDPNPPADPLPPANDPDPDPDPKDHDPDPNPDDDKDKVPTFESVEDYNKVLQSTASKAKNDILKEIGFNSVSEIKDAIAKGQNVQQIVDELTYTKEELQYLRNEKKQAEDTLLLTQAGVAPEFSEAFLKLVDGDQSGRPRLDVALEIKNAFLTGQLFTDLQPGVKIGGGKSDPIPTDEAIAKVRAAAGLKD